MPLEWTYFQFGSNGEVHTERAFEPQFIDDGQAAFRLYTNYQTHECAGIRQAVTLEKGAVYKLMVRILARPRQENDGLTSSGWVSPWIGVDLSGGISPLAGTVMKQSWVTAESAKFDEYRDFELSWLRSRAPCSCGRSPRSGLSSEQKCFLITPGWSRYRMGRAARMTRPEAR